VEFQFVHRQTHSQTLRLLELRIHSPEVNDENAGLDEFFITTNLECILHGRGRDLKAEWGGIIP